MVIMGLERVRGKVCHGEKWLWERKKEYKNNPVLFRIEYDSSWIDTKANLLVIFATDWEWFSPIKNVSHICNFKSSCSHIKKVKRNKWN